MSPALRLWLLSNSLVLVMATIWLGSWFAQAVTGWSDHNSDQLAHGDRAGFDELRQVLERSLLLAVKATLDVADLNDATLFGRQIDQRDEFPRRNPAQRTRRASYAHVNDIRRLADDRVISF